MATPPFIKKPPAAPSPIVAEFKSMADKVLATVQKLVEVGPTDASVAEVRTLLLGFHAQYEKINGNRSIAQGDKAEIDDIRKTMAERLERMYLPQLADLILVRAPQPGAEGDGGGDFILATSLFRVVAGVIGTWGYKRNAKETRSSLTESLLMTAQGFGNIIKRRLSEEGLPNLQGIVTYLIKMEIILWALEELQATAHLETGRAHIRILARMAVRRVCDLIERHAGRANKAMERDFARLFAGLDDLIILTEKILEGEEAERSRGDTAMAETMGKTLIDQFVRKMTALFSAFLADTREKLIADPTGDELFELRLDQIEKLIDFATLVTHTEAPDSLVKLTNVMRKETRDLATALLQAQRAFRGDPDAEAGLAEKLDAIQDFMTQHGWGADAQQLRQMIARAQGAAAAPHAPSHAPAMSGHGGGGHPASVTHAAAVTVGAGASGGADPMTEIQEKLRKLTMLLENGLITQAEHDGMRQTILSQL